jgi:hypothetical protein
MTYYSVSTRRSMTEKDRAKAVVKDFTKYGLTLDEYTVKQYAKLGVWAYHLLRK